LRAKEPPISSLYRVIGNPELAHILWDICDIKSMLQLGATNREIYAALKNYMQRAYDINSLLSRFFPDPDVFRVLQRRSATLIGGSHPLQFFARTLFSDKPLDLYLYPGRERELGAYLLSLGYTFVPRKSQMSKGRYFLKQDAGAYSPDPRPAAYPNRMEREEVYTLEWDDELEHGVYEEDESRQSPMTEHSAFNMLGVRRAYSFVKNDEEKLLIRILVSNRSPMETILNTSQSSTFLTPHNIEYRN
jgi:hypothetical protein